MNRRAFLTAAAAAPAAALARAPKEPAPMIPIVDTHQHLWDPTKFTLAWLQPGTPTAKVLGHRFGPSEYAAATAGLNVVKAVYMEVDVVPEQQQAEADYVIDLCKGGTTPTVAAVVSGRPASDDFARYVTQFKGSKYVKGLRQVLHVDTTPAGYALDAKFVKGVQLLGDLGLSFDLCVRPAELPDFAKLIDRCPNTRFILDHCGNADLKHGPADRERWKKDMADIAKRPNLVGKVSGFVASAAARGKWTVDDLAPVIDHTLEVFGPDRVMFGGDWPVVLLGANGYADWVNALKAVVQVRPADVQRKLFHDNAVAFYGLG